MKVVLFEISEGFNQARLEYRSGGTLTIKEMNILRNYLSDLISQKISCEPKERGV